MKILSVVGARPEIVQALPVSRALRPNHHEILVHTGQHYDYLMSQKFFEELDIPSPDYNLEAGSDSPNQQIAKIMIRMEKVISKEQPDLMIVRGDTNSTLAGALAACKLNLPVVHIEAGERSFNRSMPEEINRLTVDCLASLHLCASRAGKTNLAHEGIVNSVHWVGDVMLDALTYTLPFARAKSNILSTFNIEKGKYSLATIHRPVNTDDPQRLREIICTFNELPETIILPLHPRTKKALSEFDLKLNGHLILTDPVGYFDMLVLEENARLIATDSGGVQREAYYMGIPCLTLREETEWVETIEVGWNILVPADRQSILNNWFDMKPPKEHPDIYGNGNAGQNIAAKINEFSGFEPLKEDSFSNRLEKCTRMVEK